MIRSLALLSCSFTFATAAQVPTIQWQRCLGSGTDDFYTTVKVMPDGRCLISASTEGTDGDVTGHHGEIDGWIVMLDPAGTLLWQRPFGGSGVDYLYADPTPEGNVLVCGRTYSTDGDISGSHGSSEAWVSLLDGDGVTLWQRSIGGSEADSFDAFPVHTADGGHVMAGNSVSTDGDVTQNQGESDVLLAKVDAEGEVVWVRTYGGSSHDHPYSWKHPTLIGMPDGGFALLCMTQSPDGDVTGYHGSFDMWILRTDAEGELLWQRTLGSSGDDRSLCMAPTADGGLVVTGTIDRADGDVTEAMGERDWWVVKLGPDGELDWQRSLGGSRDDVPAKVLQTEDGGYLLCGATRSGDGDVTGHHNPNNTDGWLVKLDADGALSWQRALGGGSADGLYDLLPTSDGGCMAVGDVLSSNGDVVGSNGLYDAWLVRVDGAGELLWQRPFGGSNYDYFEALRPAPQGGWYAVGATASPDGDVVGHHDGLHYDVWVTYLNDPTTGLDDGSDDPLAFRAWPVPSSGLVNLDLPGNTGTLTVRDALGRSIHRAPTRSQRTSVDLTGRGPGAYILEWNGPAGQWRQQVVVH